MSYIGIVMVALGASMGALARWFLSLNFNQTFAYVPLGTLLSNLIGGYLIGLVVGCINIGVDISPEMRLLIMTGFLGGLTTFSTFSAEAVTMILKGDLTWAVLHIFLHLAGSILMTILGIYTARLIQ